MKVLFDSSTLIDTLSQAGISGGAVYDGVIAMAAESAQVDFLLTLNTKDFERVWPAGIARIASPETFSPPTNS